VVKEMPIEPPRRAVVALVLFAAALLPRSAIRGGPPAAAD
jgi:hypothetical protein